MTLKQELKKIGCKDNQIKDLISFTRRYKKKVHSKIGTLMEPVYDAIEHDVEEKWVKEHQTLQGAISQGDIDQLLKRKGAMLNELIPIMKEVIYEQIDEQMNYLNLLYKSDADILKQVIQFLGGVSFDTDGNMCIKDVQAWNDVLETLNKKFQTLIESGNDEEALPYTYFISIITKNPHIFYLHSIALQRLDKYEESVTSLVKGIIECGDDEPILALMIGLLCYALIKAGREKDAKECFDILSEVETNNIEDDEDLSNFKDILDSCKKELNL